MPAIRKLDWVAVEEIVAGKAAGWSDREIAAALGVSHTTVSRRIRSDIELRVRISAAKKREARRARDRERKVRAKARREAGLEPASRPEQGELSLARPSPGGEQALGDRATQIAQDAAHARPGRESTPHPGPVRRGGQRGGRVLKVFANSASSDPTPSLVAGAEEARSRRRAPPRPRLDAPERREPEPRAGSGRRRARGRLDAARVSPIRPHGRRDELRAARRVVLDLTASFEAREAARETLLELLEAKRSNGRPAYSLRHAAAKALYGDPARFA